MSKNKDIYGKITEYKPENSRTVLKADSIVDSIVDKFIDRSRVGKAKYGTTLDREDFSLYDWCEHSIEEAMDLILYLRKIQKTIDPKR
jgi:hypothetical protein